MADFFSNLAKQVLGAAPEVRPLLPPRFAPWPGILLPDVALRPEELAEAPARADAVLFPFPLIDPDGPAANAPLPTFRQMSTLKSASGPPLEQGQPPVAQERPETADLEQGGVLQDVGVPVPSAIGIGIDDALSGVPPPTTPSSPTSPPPVTQAEPDSDADSAVIAPPASRGANGDRLCEDTATTQRDPAVLHSQSPPPASTSRPAARPAASQEHSASSARLSEPPARTGRMLRYSQAEPIKGYAVPVEAEPAEAQPSRVEARPDRVQARTEPVGGDAEFDEARPERVQARTEPVEGHTELVEVRPERVGWQPEPAPGEMRLATQPEAGISLRLPSARPTTGEPEPAPTVRVTIGRVVVRAAPADSHPPTQRIELPRPPLSLEEYLRARQGGTR